MTTSTATAYAEDMAKEIYANCEAGTPFGLNEDTGEELTAYDWLEDVLDIEYRVGSDGKYRSALVMIGWGGPNVYVDTKRSEVLVYWYSPEASAELPQEFIDGLDEALQEMMSC